MRPRVGGPNKLGSPPAPRRSSRLAHRLGVHALALATARKAAMRDGLAATAAGRGSGAGLVRCGEPKGGPAVAPASSGCCGELERDAIGLHLAAVHSVHRRIKVLSANCGVMLSDVEAGCFMGFLGTTVAEV